MPTAENIQLDDYRPETPEQSFITKKNRIKLLLSEATEVSPSPLVIEIRLPAFIKKLLLGIKNLMTGLLTFPKKAGGHQ